MNECFSENYAIAREKFVSAARAAGAVLDSFKLAERGPDDGVLTTDIAWLGPPDASRLLVTVSGTHGVEGFFGEASEQGV